MFDYCSLANKGFPNEVYLLKHLIPASEYVLYPLIFVTFGILFPLQLNVEPVGGIY